MYQAIVVDDEKLIRSGISSFINSANIGIEIAAELKDGRDAIEYLRENDIQIVITDIKMTHISGLELAKYIYENLPNIKVIIISGYKEFEYAHQAIAYNVKNYLIKPTKPDELEKILTEIKNELDEENEFLQSKQQFNELLPLLKEEFINDILVGGLSDNYEIQRKIKLLNMNNQLYDLPCLIIEVSLNDENGKRKWDYGKEGLQNFLGNLFIGEEDLADIYKIIIDDHSAKFCVISKEKQKLSDFISYSKVYFENVKEQLKNITTMKCEIRIVYSFESLMQASGRYIILNEDEVFIEKSKILLSHIIGSQKEEAVGIINSVIGAFKDMPLQFLKEYTIKMLKVVFEKLGENINISCEKLDYNAISSFTSIEQIKEYCAQLIDNLIGSFIKEEENSAGNILLIAQKYIEENYSKDISLNDVAARTYLSPVYFSRFFKKNTGENFSDYLVRVRMTHAVEFLKQNFKVEEVSRLSGYHSSRYFYRTFKSYYGCSPKDYVRKIQLGKVDLT